MAPQTKLRSAWIVSGCRTRSWMTQCGWVMRNFLNLWGRWGAFAGAIPAALPQGHLPTLAGSSPAPPFLQQQWQERGMRQLNWQESWGVSCSGYSTIPALFLPRASLCDLRVKIVWILGTVAILLTKARGSSLVFLLLRVIYEWKVDFRPWLGSFPLLFLQTRKCL